MFLDAVADLIKDAYGGERAGHKYLSRRPKAGGGWEYVYYNPAAKPGVKAGDDAPEWKKKVAAALKGQGLSKLPPPKDIDPGSIRVNVDGDIDSHVVLTWRDKKGRTQYAYTDGFHRRQDAEKWDRVTGLLPKLAEGLGNFRSAIQDKGTSTKERDTAAIMAIIAHTGLRPGHPQHLKAEGTRGISTLGPENIKINGSTVLLEFKGKAGKINRTELTDPVIAGYLKQRLKERAGENVLWEASATDLPKRLKAAGLDKFHPKDFRTAIATIHAANVLAAHPGPPPPLPADEKKALAAIKKVVNSASEEVAKRLNNTPAMARKAYISPSVIGAWVEDVGGGHLMDKLFKADGVTSHPLVESARAGRLLQRALASRPHAPSGPVGFVPDEDGDGSLPEDLEAWVLPAILSSDDE